MRPSLRLFATASLALWVSSSACSSSESTTAAPNATPAEGDAGVDGASTEPNALATAIDELVAGATSEEKFSGSVIVVDHGSVVFEKGYGEADRTTHRMNDASTIFRIGSVSKQFTATAVLALAEEGKLALTDPVSKYFPDYPKENLAQDGAEVTLHHLISHSSGLPDPRQTDWFKDNVWTRPIDPSEQVTAAMPLPLVAKPGTAYRYVNYNFLLAALVIEKVSGKSYESYLKTRLWEPAGMVDTGTVLPADKKDRAAVGYYDSGGTLRAFGKSSAFKDPDVTLAFGSGQIFSTVSDLAKWDRALASGSVLRDPAPLFKANLGRYGYGWVIEDRGPVKYHWHNGAISPLGFSSLVVRIPSQDRFVAYLSNFDTDIVDDLETEVAKLAVK